MSELPVEQPASRLAALTIDATLAFACYLIAYRLRFTSSEFELFLPSALRALPFVVGAQIAALLACRAYAYRQGRRWFPRLLAGVCSGTAAGALLTWAMYGFEGISRISFAVDALLLVLATFGWRAASGIARLARLVREEHAMRTRSKIGRQPQASAPVCSGSSAIANSSETW